MLRLPRRLLFAALVYTSVNGLAQAPFQFPTANHSLYDVGCEQKFFAPTAPDKPVSSGSFGCVRNSGTRMHEGLDILHQHTDKHGEPTDPVMATADGTVMYFSTKPGLSNYGRYVVIRHVIEGVDIYSLYAHLSEMQPGLKFGDTVKAGQVIGTMGRSSSAETIAKDRAHVHFELNLMLNENFAAWFKKNSTPGERNDHGAWNGQNLLGLDPRDILLAEHHPTKNFSLLDFVRSQTELCRVQVRAKTFPFVKRYPGLVLKNPVADKEGVAGYEIALNYNGVPFALMPRAASEMKGVASIQLISVNAAVAEANHCRKLVTQARGRWQLGDKGRREIELLIY
jgi:murein DD-endopeptidase MepM/ murein hydrolase activator NlpD